MNCDVFCVCRHFASCCPADVTGGPDVATSDSDVPLPVPMGDPGDAPGAMKSVLGSEQGEKADLEGLFGFESSPVKVVVEPDEPAARESLSSKFWKMGQLRLMPPSMQTPTSPRF